MVASLNLQEIVQILAGWRQGYRDGGPTSRPLRLTPQMTRSARESTSTKTPFLTLNMPGFFIVKTWFMLGVLLHADFVTCTAVAPIQAVMSRCICLKTVPRNDRPLIRSSYVAPKRWLQTEFRVGPSSLYPYLHAATKLRNFMEV